MFIKVLNYLINYCSACWCFLKYFLDLHFFLQRLHGKEVPSRIIICFMTEIKAFIEGLDYDYDYDHDYDFYIWTRFVTTIKAFVEGRLNVWRETNISAC